MSDCIHVKNRLKKKVVKKVSSSSECVGSDIMVDVKATTETILTALTKMRVKH